MSTTAHAAFKRSLAIVILVASLLANFQNVQAVAPTNDLFSNATLISGTPFTDTIDDVVTTATPKSGDPPNDDPLIACNNGLPGLATVWYKFVAPAPGILQVDTSGSGYNTVVAIWTGSQGALSFTSCNNDWYELVPNGTSFASAGVVAGFTYYIEITQVGGTSAAGLSAPDEAGPEMLLDQLVLNVDFFEVPVMGVGFFDDRDAAWTYTGTWLQFNGAGPSADTETYSSTQNSVAEFNFTGTQFTLYHRKASDGGQLVIWIDGVQAPDPLSQNSATTLWQQTWVSPMLDPGTHRIRLVNLSGTTYIDAIRVTNQVAPLGYIGTNYNPTYQWGHVSNATWYYLWVSGPSGKILDRWYQASSVCGGSLCAVNPGVTLGGGNYSWWVQTWNIGGYGPWSSAKQFSTAPLTLPTQPVLSFPSGNIGTNYSPTYTFDDTGGSWYELYLSGPGGVLIDQWYSASQAGCDGSECTITPAITLGSGNFVWWVRPWNSLGYGPWSSGLGFSTDVPPLPTQPGQSFPVNDIGSNYSPTYTFDDAGGTWYQLYVSQSGNIIINQWFTSVEAACDGLECSITPTTALEGGNYDWWVRPWNSAGYGPWSDGLSFSTNIPSVPAKPVQTSPTGNIGMEYSPTYIFEDTGGSWYNLYVSGAGGVLLDQWYTSGEASCSSGTCSITPTITLDTGNFNWWVRPWNAAGYGPWSDGLTFSTDIPEPPTKPGQTSPTGDIGTNYSPTYTFDDTGGTWYQLYVSQPSGIVINQWFSSVQAGCNGTACALTPTTSLGGGSFTWWVRPWNSAGYGPWSDGLTFSTELPSPPVGVP